MLDNLVESRSYAGESRKFRGLFVVTSILMTIILLTGFVVNLFSQELALGSESLELSTLVAPVETPPEKPPIEMPQKETQTKSSAKQDKVPTREFNIQRTDETPVKVPDKISTTPLTNKARPNSYFQLGRVDSDPVTKGGSFGSERTGSPKNNSTSIKPGPEIIAKNDEEKNVAPPPVLEKPTPKVEKKKKIISGGVVNGKATNLVTPVYPAAAKNIGAKGDVKVEVTISEDGNVISANILDGHPLLRQSALRAAKSSKFTPTLLSGEKVQVKGIIVYRFAG